uniref:Uncharacterized protein n=1 Tax=Fundulus heteroclitus TaxID=8078 RepID=A0A3Q2QSB7_FUNHE
MRCLSLPAVRLTFSCTLSPPSGVIEACSTTKKCWCCLVLLGVPPPSWVGSPYRTTGLLKPPAVLIRGINR